jgi:hypothetical protein
MQASLSPPSEWLETAFAPEFLIRASFSEA